jgi:hypothetical protein
MTPARSSRGGRNELLGCTHSSRMAPDKYLMFAASIADLVMGHRIGGCSRTRRLRERSRVMPDERPPLSVTCPPPNPFDGYSDTLLECWLASSPRSRAPWRAPSSRSRALMHNLAKPLPLAVATSSATIDRAPIASRCQPSLSRRRFCSTSETIRPLPRSVFGRRLESSSGPDMRRR